MAKPKHTFILCFDFDGTLVHPESDPAFHPALGEMIRHLSAADVRVPGGFATTSEAFREFLAQDGLAERIQQRLDTLDTDDVAALTAAGREIRDWVSSTPLPAGFEAAIAEAYAAMAANAPAGFSVAASGSTIRTSGEIADRGPP